MRLAERSLRFVGGTTNTTTEQVPDALNGLVEVLARRVTAVLEETRDDGFLNVDGAAEFLGGCSRKAVYHLVERGRIRAHRVGGRLLFSPRELRADVERGD